jgi:hypothetical protein
VGSCQRCAQVWPDPALVFGYAVPSRWPIEGAAYHSLPLAADADAFTAGVPWELVHVQTAGLDAQLAFHEPLTGTLASDHSGLVVDIAWPARPA